MNAAANKQDPEIWAAAKKTIKHYLNKLQTEHDFSVAETTYDVLQSEEKMVIFSVHETLQKLLKKEVRERDLVKSYRIAFSDVDPTTNTCQMKIEASGFESYIFAGMLTSIVSSMEKLKGQKIIQSKGAILAIIAEVISAKNIRSQFICGLRHHKGLFIVSLTFKKFHWKAMEFQNPDAISLIAEIAQQLPDKIQKELNKEN